MTTKYPVKAYSPTNLTALWYFGNPLLTHRKDSVSSCISEVCPCDSSSHLEAWEESTHVIWLYKMSMQALHNQTIVTLHISVANAH